MIKLEVGMGYSVIEEEITLFSSNRVFSQVSQHRIILSENVVNYYLEMIPPSNKDRLKLYLQNIMGNNSLSVFYASSPTDIDVKKEIIDLTSRAKMKILVADPKEFNGYDTKHIHLTSPEQISSHTFDVLFNRYTLPIRIPIKQGNDCDPIIRWLNNVLVNESSIDIVDPYLLQERNFKAYMETIFPGIPTSAVVNIFFAIDRTEEDEYKRALQLISESTTGKWTYIINECQYRDMHDRFIHLDDCEIVFSGGLSMLLSGRQFRKPGTITVDKEKSYDLPPTIGEKLNRLRR